MKRLVSFLLDLWNPWRHGDWGHRLERGCHMEFVQVMVIIVAGVVGIIAICTLKITGVISHAMESASCCSLIGLLVGLSWLLDRRPNGGDRALAEAHRLAYLLRETPKRKNRKS